MAERGRDEPIRRHRLDPARAAAGEPRRPLQVADRGVHRRVRGGHLLGRLTVTERPKQRHGLRGPEGVIEPRHLPGRMRCELLTGVGVAGVEHRPQLLGGDLTSHAEGVGAVAEPPSRLLAAGEVVALHPVALRDGGEVVVRPPRGHPPDVQHRS
jgi:hypothetical protein